MENQRPKKQWFLKLYLRIAGLICIYLDCEHFSRWISTSEVVQPFVRHCHPLCWLFVQHMVIVSIPFPYPKCHSVKLLVTLWPSLVNCSLHPSLANWLQLWIEYGLESLVCVIINKWNPIYLVDRSSVKWLLLVISVIWMICRACLNFWTLTANGC